MMLKILSGIFSSIFFIVTCQAAGDVAWSYEGTNGPTYWKSIGYGNCEDSAQSPIDLPSEKSMEYSESLGTFTLNNFDDKTALNSLLLKNNGHTAQLDIDGNLNVQGGNLPDRNTFYPAQLHFHWGSDKNTGSEHLYLGQQYPLEVHIVTYNSKYGSLGNAADKSDGLAVLGFFYEQGNTNNCNYEHLLKYLANVKTPHTNTSIPTFNLRHLLPESIDKFYRYKGSLTTPPCYESVTWTVFKDTIKISKEQLDLFRELGESSTKNITMNYRPKQNRNGRKVYINFNANVNENANSASSPFINYTTAIVLVFLATLF